MKRLIVLTTALTLTLPAVGHAATTLEPVAPLRADGSFMRDAVGRVVPVRGLFGKWKLPGGAPRSETGDAETDAGNANSSFGRRDAELVAGLGSTAFRLAWFWDELQPLPPPAPLRLAYLARIEDVQKDLAQMGVFSIIDAHQDLYGRRYGGGGAGPSGPIDSPGFPDWATIDDGIPHAVSFGFPANYLLPETSQAFTSLWLNRRGILAAFAQAWRVVARRFADNPHVLAYDLMNEPWPGTGYPACAQPAGCPAFDIGLLQPAMERLARAVHSVDPRRPALFEPHLLFNLGVPSHLGQTYRVTGLPSGVAPAGASYHDQCITRAVIGPAASSVGKTAEAVSELLRPACSVSDALVMDRGLELGRRLSGPAIMTELQPTFSDDVAGIECLIEKAEARMAGYTYGLSWSPRGSTTELRQMFAPAPDPGDPRAAEAATARAKAMVLARAAPIAIAGQPIGWGFDPRTGRFDLRFKPSGSMLTSVFVPARQYPNGYEVAETDRLRLVAQRDIVGGRLLGLKSVGGPGIARLRIERRPGPVPDLPELPPCR